MMIGNSLESLNRQKSSVNEGMRYSRQIISDAEDKIRRLQQASISMKTTIQGLRNVSSEINDFEVAKGQWKGEKEKVFVDKYEQYKSSVHDYSTKTSEAKNEIDEDLEQARAEKAHAEIGWVNLQSTLNRLEDDIKAVKEV